jgi:TonB family protein
MSFLWQQCEGQVVNNTYLLQKYLGGSRDSGVFLTQLSGPESPRAAIKLIPAGNGADLQLSLWRRASQLSHPNLIRLFQYGRCHLADMDLLYVVMEYAEEDLSQILPERPLTSSEARQMLEPMVSALAFLHGQGLVHTRIKPSNVLATGDQLKLSSDTMFPVGASRKAAVKSDVYAAPESGDLPLSPAVDSWSLGITLVEALTQVTPKWQQGHPEEPEVPEIISQPFLDIARNTLRKDPQLRWSIVQIQACMNPVAVAAAAAQSLSPLSIPVSSVPAVPAAKLQSPKPAPPALKAPAPAPQRVTAPKQTMVLPNYVIPLAVAALLVVGILILPKILGHRAETSSSGPAAATSPNAGNKQIVPGSNVATPPVTRAPAQPASQTSVKAAVDKKPANESLKTPAALPATDVVRTEPVVSANAPRNSPGNPARGEVLDQVLPEVSEKALATIQGTVRVTVLLHVDAAGNVSQADLDSAGPSQYFADLALKASRRWEFTSPEVDGHSVPSEWRVRFEFRQSGVKAFPTQTAP